MQFVKNISRHLIQVPALSTLAILVIASMPMLLCSPLIYAGELVAGTVIDASNIDEMSKETFEQHPISELIPPNLERLVRDLKLRIRIRHSKVPTLDPQLLSLTKKYSSAVSFNEKTKQIEGYVAGIPFPDITVDDPNAGYKVIYNNFYFMSINNNGENVLSSTLLIDSKKGLDQINEMNFASTPMVGRWDEPHTMGDGSLAKRELVVLTAPYDIRGVGTFTKRFVDGRPDETTAYLRSIRRLRRVTGGAWMDQVGGADYLYDDINGFNAHPTWYKNFRYVKRQFIFGLVFDKNPRVRNSASREAEFPAIDLKNPPYWNPTLDWAPTEVHVVEAITPTEHPYSKKLYYFSVAIPGLVTMGEFYDKQGALWKMDLLGSRAGFTDAKGRKMPGAGYISYVIDVKRLHASVTLGWDVPRTGLNPEDASEAKLLEVVK